MREFKIIAALADLHIGVKHVSAKTLKEQLKDHFFKPLEDMKYLDGIFLLGDLMHTIVSLNSDYSQLFHWFIDRVYKIAKKRGATVIIIRGTISHDNDQLDNIRHYIKNDDGVDFRIYDTVEEITLWDDYKVLVIPDVKVKQLKDVGKYLKEPNKYDMILGHGTISQMQYVIQESENMPTKTYIFDADELIQASKGPVLFGHIHQYQSIQRHFYYVGPFTMLERGTTDAGFAVVGIYDKDRSKFKVEHYLNPDSAEYHELVVTRSILRDIPIDEIVEAIDEVAKDAKSNDLITLRIVLDDNRESADKVMILENRYRKDRRFSIIKKVKSKQEQDREKEQEKRREKVAYLMDENMELPSILYTYYTNEVKPTIPDRTSLEANITLEDFERALKASDK